VSTRGLVAEREHGKGPVVHTIGVGSAGAADEAGLLARVVAGDAGAFRVLVERHVAGVTAVARRLLGDAGDAEDVAQEAFLRLWTRGGSVEVGAGGIKPWLRRVVSNLAIDRLRARRGTDVVDEVPEKAEPPGQLIDIEERELTARVDRAVQALPERQRRALALFHFEGLSQREVAEIMGLGEEAVESLLARARRTLKASLADEWRGLLPESGTGEV
jgi:RNA polymerase sigma-70 factor (ECF subfamily)